MKPNMILFLFFAFLLIVTSVPGTSCGGCSSEFEKDFLDATNRYRGGHGAPPVTLASEISTWAQEWADHLASSGAFEHRSPNKYGENLYMSGGGSGGAKGSESVKAWYNEIDKYRAFFGKEPDMGQFMGFGHFTQLLWRETSRIGVGCGQGSSGFYVVGNYDPAGNMNGAFAGNVVPPIE